MLLLPLVPMHCSLKHGTMRRYVGVFCVFRRDEREREREEGMEEKEGGYAIGAHAVLIRGTAR